MSSHASVLDTHTVNAWMVALNKRFRPRLGCLRFRGFSGMLGIRPGIEYGFPIAGGIKAAIEVEVGPSEVQPHVFGHLLQGVQTLGQQVVLQGNAGPMDSVLLLG